MLAEPENQDQKNALPGRPLVIPQLDRIINHWTGGKYHPNHVDKRHYHRLIDITGKVHDGIYSPEDNISTGTPYAAHTRGLNTGSIGVAVCGMWRKVARKIHDTEYPILWQQVDAMLEENARLALKYELPIDERTIIHHAVIEDVYKVRQNGKVDFIWLPCSPTDAIEGGAEIHDWMIRQVQERYDRIVDEEIKKMTDYVFAPDPVTIKGEKFESEKIIIESKNEKEEDNDNLFIHGILNNLFSVLFQIFLRFFRR